MKPAYLALTTFAVLLTAQLAWALPPDDVPEFSPDMAPFLLSGTAGLVLYLRNRFNK